MRVPLSYQGSTKAVLPRLEGQNIFRHRQVKDNKKTTWKTYVSNRTPVPLLCVLRKLVQKEFRVYLGLETLSCMSQKKKHHTQTQSVASSKTTNKRTDDDDEQQQEEAKRALVEKMSRSRRALTFPLAGDYDRGGCVLLFVVFISIVWRQSSSSRGWEFSLCFRGWWFAAQEEQ